MTARDHLDSLNPAQRQAVMHGMDGSGRPAPPLLIIAGAGTGKTGTLAHRVARLIIEGADPRRILLLTFSRRAAAEMIARVERICAESGAIPAGQGKVAWAGTFHAVGARLLRAHAHSIGLDPGFTILDREDGADLMNLVRDQLGFSAGRNRFPKKGTCQAIYSYAVNAESPLSEILPKAFPWCEEWEAELKALFASYVEAKQAQVLLDYDDLLLYWADMMRIPELAEDVAARFDHVLVDEYQDTNRLQASILLGLKPGGEGLTVVGDDAQAIYSFRAATIRNILDFPDQFRPAAAVIRLEQNYRSTQPILDACNAVIRGAAETFAKMLRSDRASHQKPRLVTVQDEGAQAAYVVAQILAARESGIDLRQQAVLFRTSHHSGALEIELARRNIPFVKYGGLKFLETGHVRDLVAILRWVENPRDRMAGFRVLQLLPGVGPATAAKALDHLQGSGFAADALASFRAPAAAAGDWPAFADLFGLLQRGAVAWTGQLELARDWYRPQLERLYDAAQSRLSDVEHLVQLAANYPTRRAFLEDMTLDPPDASSDQSGPPLRDDDYLILSTIHSAKGQEWKCVHVLNVVDGCIPSDLATGSGEEIDEERRLLYVAMTRARDQLHLVLPQRFFTHQQRRGGDRHVYVARSRFLPSAILNLFETCAWVPGQFSDDRAGPAGRRFNLAERQKAMWR